MDAWWTCPDCGTMTNLPADRHRCLSNIHVESLRNRFGADGAQQEARPRAGEFANPPFRNSPLRQEAPPRQEAAPKKPKSPKKKRARPAWPTASTAQQPPTYGPETAGVATPNERVVFASVQKLLIKKIEKGILGDLAAMALEAVRYRDSE